MKYYAKDFRALLAALSLAAASLYAPASIAHEDAALSAPGAEASQRLDEFSPVNNLTQQRYFVLENKLQVLLRHNPKRQTASVAMNVGIGSFAEPEAFPGLSHFLEHLLFLGTAKYPEVGSYDAHLKKYQGSNNAFTSRDNTNYHFSINHDGLAEALDRFADFFVAPSFHPDFVDKERKAVNDEAVMDLEQDGWRELLITTRLMKPSHPFRRYHIGNLETLKDITPAKVRAFYEEHYSASDMSLVIDSSFSLDEMEAWAREKFRAIPDRGKKQQAFPGPLFDEEGLPRSVEMKSLEEKRSLILQFNSPALDATWAAKPDHIIGHLVGHEGHGSLLAFLKSRNLAQSLSAGYVSTNGTSLMQVTVELTPEGLEQKDFVIEAFFAYVRELREKGFSEELFSELQRMAEINYYYTNPNHGGSMPEAIAFSQLMAKHPALSAEQRSSLYYEHNPQVLQDTLASLVPEKMLILLSHSQAQTDAVDPDFGIGYRMLELSDSARQAWRAPRGIKELSLPAPNKFVPEQLSFEKVQGESRRENILEKAWGSFWLEEDTRLGLPKGRLKLLLINPGLDASPATRALTQLYSMVLNKVLSEWKYELMLAGVSSGMAFSDRGLELDLNGFVEKMPLILEELGQRLTTITCSEADLEGLKLRLKEFLANQSKDAPYLQAYYKLHYAEQPLSVDPELIFHAASNRDLVSGISVSEIENFARSFFAELRVEGAAYGRFKKTAVQESLATFFAKLGAQPSKTDVLPAQVKTLSEDDRLLVSFQRPSDNHAWAMQVQFGERSPELDASLRIADAFISHSFYHELRTLKNLGYVVQASLAHSWNRLGLKFLVQSSSHSPAKIAEIYQSWLTAALKEMRELPEEAYAALREGVVKKLREESHSLAELFSDLDRGAYMFGGNFAYTKQTAEAAQGLSKDAVLACLERALVQGKAGRIEVHLVGEKAALASAE